MMDAFTYSNAEVTDAFTYSNAEVIKFLQQKIMCFYLINSMMQKKQNYQCHLVITEKVPTSTFDCSFDN